MKKSIWFIVLVALMLHPMTSLGAPALDGFAGVPWGASKDQIIEIMSKQGYKQLPGGRSTKLAFKGAYAGISCQLNYELTANSFSEASAENFDRASSSLASAATFNRIVDLLSKEYGPPRKQGSDVIRADKGGAIISLEYAEWDFVDGSTSDKYRISVEDYVTSTQKGFDQEKLYENDVHVTYHADSLRLRLKMKK